MRIVRLNDMHKIAHLFKLETMKAFNEALQTHLCSIWGRVVVLKEFSKGGIIEQRLCCVDEAESIFVDLIAFMKTFDEGHFDECSTEQMLIDVRSLLR